MVVLKYRWHLVFFVSSQTIKDVHLLVIVAGLLAVDVVFLSCWNAIDPLQAKILAFKDMVRHIQSSTLYGISAHTIAFIFKTYSVCQIKVFYIDLLLSRSLLLAVFAHADELCVSVYSKNIRHVKSQGRVVRKPFNVNPRLNVNWGIAFSCLKMFFISNAWCSLRLLQLY